MHIDCIQKFHFSSNENVALPGQHHLGISKKKKRKEEHDIALSSFLIIPEGFKLSGCCKM